MSGKERREQIAHLLKAKDKAISGGFLADHFDVSRQVIVQDIALLRANGLDIISTNRGYVLRQTRECSRVFKVYHTDAEVEDELFLIVDLGGTIQDILVYHRAYGTLRAEMNIRSRKDARNFIEDIKSGKSSLLKNVTGGFHYHTVTAANEETLDQIMEALRERGFLAQLQDYEPVDFWSRSQAQ